jgi:hypothetical protein
MKNSSELRAGEWVQVRSKEEILETLDKMGQLDGLPFMPEMFAFCGKRYRVFKRAHKTCDPPNGIAGRRMLNAVHLEDIRCNGDAHGGCEARCLVFWKEAWLKKVDGESPLTDRKTGAPCGCTEQDVVAGARKQGEQDEPIFICQSTQIAQATLPLRWWDPRQYVEDYTSGNTRLSTMLASLLVALYAEMVSSGLGLGAALRWIYDTFQKIRGGPVYPWRVGKIPRGARTPSAKLDVQPGDLIKIRSYQEILATINEDGANRGMLFDAEMVPYCGGTYPVLARVTRIINEKTGKMQNLQNDCIMLDGVVCSGCYSKYRKFCPRSIHSYWREIWLERVAPNQSLGTKLAPEEVLVEPRA